MFIIQDAQLSNNFPLCPHLTRHCSEVAFTGLLASHLWRMASQCRSLFSPFVCGCGKALQPCIVCVVVLPGLLYTCMYVKKCLWTAESLVQQFRLILIVCSEEKKHLTLFLFTFCWFSWRTFFDLFERCSVDLTFSTTVTESFGPNAMMESCVVDMLHFLCVKQCCLIKRPRAGYIANIFYHRLKAELIIIVCSVEKSVTLTIISSPQNYIHWK